MQIESWPIIVELFPDYAFKLAVSLLCGTMLGLERERREKPAGLRTIVLITVGATLFMIVSELIPRVTMGPESVTRSDPSRVAAQVVSGIGFIGAGTIIQSRGSVHGLTTAAVIWLAAAVGLCVGIGFPLLAIGFTLVLVALLLLLTAIRRRFITSGKEVSLTLLVNNDSLRVAHVRSVLEGAGAHLDRFDVRPRDTDRVHVDVHYYVSEGAAASVLETLMKVDGVRGEPVLPGTGSAGPASISKR